MPRRDYHEALWETVPAGQVPADFERRLEFLRVRVRPGERLLDIGSGEGDFAAAMLAHGAQAVAADVAEEPLRRARERHPGLDARLVDAEGELPFEDAAFDVVWAGEVLEHVADTGAFVSELRRVLRSGGRLVLSTPNHPWPLVLGLALRPRRFDAHFDPRGEHLRFYTASTLRALLEDMGFEWIELHAAAGLPGAPRLLLASAVRSRF